ncbi:MAG: hypothetical protein HY682_10975, partial [Chloroflexi bacterium]|nr:hypothetical protein [Chloroflexota bacterium]
PGDVILGDDDGVVVLPSQLANEILEEAIEHDEMEQALLDHVLEKRVSPSGFYPFNEETRKIYERWKQAREHEVSPLSPAGTGKAVRRRK